MGHILCDVPLAATRMCRCCVYVATEEETSYGTHDTHRAEPTVNPLRIRCVHGRRQQSVPHTGQLLIVENITRRRETPLQSDDQR